MWTSLGSIPSPSKSYLDLGIVELRAYGLMIALGVLAAVWFSQKRWKQYGEDPEDISNIALWAVPAGLIGSRIYHVITDWRSYQGRWEDAIKIWEGGLGIPGGLAAGVIVGVMYAQRNDISVPKVLDAMIPSLPLAQAIGRWGNWFNQELFISFEFTSSPTFKFENSITVSSAKRSFPIISNFLIISALDIDKIRKFMITNNIVKFVLVKYFFIYF